jgi:hypothetical protein
MMWVAWPLPALAQQTDAPHAGSQATQPSEALEALIRQLGDEQYTRREQATHELLSRGPDIVPYLRAHLPREDDPEIQHRLRYILDNIIPPRQAVLLVRAASATGLQPGDVITHANSRRVRNESELRQRLVSMPRASLLRVRGPSGPREAGPVRVHQLTEMFDYVAPRGEVIARAVRLYATGFAEQAYEVLRTLAQPVPENELSTLLHARLAHTAGHGATAIELLADHLDSVRPSGADWSSPSYLDLSGPGKAPFRLEWVITTQAGPDLYATDNDPDLRVQRILFPAHRYADAFERTAGYWWQHSRDELGRSAATDRVAGNQLAVAAWMLHALGLRSECCRLIEPRSMILRRSSRGIPKWVRVETDAWLPFLAGDAQAALDGFYEDALSILQRPPRPGDPGILVRNPQVAARVALFLYQFPDDPRVAKALESVSHHTHPALTEYLDWMLYALRAKGQAAIRRDLQAALPHLSDDRVLPYARAVALLEYVQPQPDPDVLRTARRRLSNAPAGPDRDVWLAIVDALLRLVEGRPSAARRPLLPFRDRPETWAVWHTAGFLSDPPVSVANHPALRRPLLAVPLGPSEDHWLILGRDHRLLHFDADASLLSALEQPTPSWFPSPLTWPWVGREPAGGRVWVYCRRRVAEVIRESRGAATAWRIRPLLNVRTADIAAFDRYVGPHFSVLAETLAASASSSGENSEFLRRELQAHGEYFADPDLPALGLVQPLRAAPRVVHVAVRGGPHLLIDTKTGRCWTSAWVAKQLELEATPEFFAQALWEPALDGSPVVFLMSDQGLMRFELGAGRLARVALPGPDPYPALIPESTPYLRRDSRYVYCARLPQDGGQVYRVLVDDDRVEAVDMINEALPEHYYDVRSRAEIRAALDERLKRAQLPDLQTLLVDAAETVARWDRAQPQPP